MQYIESPGYQQDLLAVRRIWGEPECLGIAGMFIFLSYITLPILTIVQPARGPARMSTMKIGLENGREKSFLQRMLGLSTESVWQGGIRCPVVRDMILSLHQGHLQLVGMRPEYMDYLSGIVSLSVLRVHAVQGNYIDISTRLSYWRYMQYACSLLGTNLDEELATQERCQEFIYKHTQLSLDGKILFSALQETYSSYVEKSLPVLFQKTFFIIQKLMEDNNVSYTAPALCWPY
jgi:hypothetical protein